MTFHNLLETFLPHSSRLLGPLRRGRILAACELSDSVSRPLSRSFQPAGGDALFSLLQHLLSAHQAVTTFTNTVFKMSFNRFEKVASDSPDASFSIASNNQTTTDRDTDFPA